MKPTVNWFMNRFPGMILSRQPQPPDIVAGKDSDIKYVISRESLERIRRDLEKGEVKVRHLTGKENT
jgi:hypothetical protein